MLNPSPAVIDMYHARENENDSFTAVKASQSEADYHKYVAAVLTWVTVKKVKLPCNLVAGMFNRSIDVHAASEKNVLVTGTNTRTNPTLVHIWALILATTRHIITEDANIKSGNPQWQSVIPTDLTGKTLSLLGLGRFGTMVAQVRLSPW